MSRTRWSSRSLGSRLQHGIFYAFIRSAGVFGGYFLLFFVVSWFTIVPSVRNRSMPYIVRRFPKSSFALRLLHTWRLQWLFGQCLVDRAAAGLLGRFAFDTAELTAPEDLAEKEKGLILLSAHTGCWQMAPYMLATLALRPITVLTHKERADVDKHAHEHAGIKAPYSVVYTDAGVAASLALVATLGRGELVCMMGDRIFNPEEPGVAVTFMGASVHMPVAAYRLASACGVPIAIAFSLRTGPEKGTLLVSKTLHVPPGLGRTAENYRPYAQLFANALEEFIHEHPYQFFNFYNVWEQ